MPALWLLLASDGPELSAPGHRRDKVDRRNSIIIAALPQPPASDLITQRKIERAPGLRVGCHRGRVGYVDPDVNVGRAAEVPDERRSFEPPAVPDLVVAQVAFLVEGQRAPVETALGLQAGGDFIAVRLTIGLDQLLQHLL